MLDRAEEIEEQKAARRERSPSLHAGPAAVGSNGSARHVGEKQAMHPGQAARSRGATASHESTPTPAGAAGVSKGGASTAASGDVPDELLPYLSRGEQARIKAQRERAGARAL